MSNSLGIWWQNWDFLQYNIHLSSALLPLVLYAFDVIQSQELYSVIELWDTS